jgi:hypothetical protein
MSYLHRSMKFPVFLLLAALFTAVPLAFTQAPGADKFAAGQRKTFSTEGHDKAKGVKLMISYPDSWEPTAGETPDVVQMITSSRGFGMEVLRLEFKSLGLPEGTQLKPAEQAKYFTAPALKPLIPADAKLVTTKPALVQGRSGVILEHTRSEKRGPKVFEFYVQTYAFIQGTTMVLVHCQVGGVVGGGPPVAQRMRECKPLFEQIVKSIVLPPAAK